MQDWWDKVLSENLNSQTQMYIWMHIERLKRWAIKSLDLDKTSNKILTTIGK